MKKLNLKGIGEMLTKEQMKKITGGYFGDGDCVCLPTTLDCVGGDPLKQWGCSTPNYVGITCCPY